MKNYHLMPLLFIIISCTTNRDLKRLDSKSFSGKNNVLGLNAINANNNYYTKAIIDYLLIKKVIDGNSIREFGIPKNNPRTDTEKVVQVALFPELTPNSSYPNTNTDSIRTKLLQSGIKTCFYDLPLKLKDLQSGFQFNHYVFKSSNRAAMQAFGIVNSEVKENSLYIITDYLQYQDINCSGLPTIRYAVGMRAEFRIIGIESESQLQGIGSLAGLAAQVETNSQKVNLTIKTIGLTGIDSRLSIPSNTTFDVKTYSDYEKIIDFIRNLKDNEDKVNKDTNNQLIVQPQIIPVMDDYRASLEYSFYPMLESIELLELKLKQIEKNNLSQTKIDSIKTNINNLKLSILEDETKDLIGKYQKLNNNYIAISSTSNIAEIFTYINRKNDINSSIEQYEKNTARDSTESSNPNKSPKIINLIGGRNVLIAKDWEEKGFDYILSKEFEKAIFAFKQSEIEVPQFHSSTEIIKYLNENKSKMETNDMEYINSLKFIRQKYTWKVSEEIIKKLDDKILTSKKTKTVK